MALGFAAIPVPPVPRCDGGANGQDDSASIGGLDRVVRVLRVDASTGFSVSVDEVFDAK